MKKIITFFIIQNILFACVSTHQVGSRSEADYNQRYEIKNPAHHKKLNPVGIGVGLGFATGGAYMAYSNEIIKKVEGQEVKGIPAANIIVGGIVGWGLSEIMNRVIFKQGQYKKVKGEDEMKNWLKQKGNTDIVLDYRNESIKVIKPSVENNFKIQNLTDVYDFNKAFPSTSGVNSANIVEQAIQKFDKNYLIEVYKLYPNTSNNEKLKSRIVFASQNLTDAIQINSMIGLKNISDVSSLELKCYEQAKTLDGIKSFLSVFPNSKYKESSALKFYSSVVDLKTAKEYFALFNTTDVHYIFKNNKFSCVGQINNGLPNGNGYAFYSNNGAYKGEMKNGLRHGKGKYISNFEFDEDYSTKSDFLKYGFSGDYELAVAFFDGTWLNDKREGKGIEYAKNGLRYKGIWVADKLEGTVDIEKPGSQDFWYKATAEYVNGQQVSIDVFIDYYKYPYDGTKEGQIKLNEQLEREERNRKNNCEAKIINENYDEDESCGIKFTVSQVQCPDYSLKYIYYWPGGDCHYSTKKPTYFDGSNKNLETTNLNIAIRRVCGCEK
jgi:hypothetical protein